MIARQRALMRSGTVRTTFIGGQHQHCRTTERLISLEEDTETAGSAQHNGGIGDREEARLSRGIDEHRRLLRRSVIPHNQPLEARTTPMGRDASAKG